MKIKKNWLFSLSALLLLAGCSSTSSSSASSEVSFPTTSEEEGLVDYSIISPAGAPSLAFYQYAGASNFVTSSSVPTVLSSFASGNYDVIVMDNTQGINQISNGANYSLARIITAGNFHLVGINKADGTLPQAGDTIVSFGNSAGIPNQILTKVFPQISNLTYVSSVSDTAPIIKTGLYGGSAVDYVLTAQPLLYNLESSGTTITDDINMQQEWYTLSGLSGFPQAGVFVRNDLYSANSARLAHFLSDLDTSMGNLIYHPSIVASALSAYGDSATQKTLFGLDSTTLMALQGEDNSYDNQLGYYYGKYNFNSYLEYLGQDDYDSSIFSPLY